MCTDLNRDVRRALVDDVEAVEDALAAIAVVEVRRAGL